MSKATKKDRPTSNTIATSEETQHFCKQSLEKINIHPPCKHRWDTEKEKTCVSKAKIQCLCALIEIIDRFIGCEVVLGPISSPEQQSLILLQSCFRFDAG